MYQVKVQLLDVGFTLTHSVEIFLENNKRWLVVYIAPQGTTKLQKHCRDYDKLVLSKPFLIHINVSTEASVHF